MPRICPECGDEVEDGFKFCPDCGAAVPVAKKSKTASSKKKKNVKQAAEEQKESKKVETSKPEKEEKVKRELPFKAVFQVFSKRRTRVAVLGVVFAVLIIAAAVLFVSPLELTSAVAKQPRSFTIVIENTLDEDVPCSLKFDTLKYIAQGDPINIPAGETVTVVVNEKDLMVQSDTYDLTLYATVEYMDEVTAVGITKSATFQIGQQNGKIVTCTGSL